MSNVLKVFIGIIAIIFISLNIYGLFNIGIFSSGENINQESRQQTEETTGLTSEEKRYVTFMADHSERMENALGNLGRSMENYDYSNIATRNVAIDIVEIEDLCQEYYNYGSAPEKFTEVDNYYYQSIISYEESLHYLVRGIDNMNTADLERARRLMEEGIYYTTKTTEALRRVER